MSFFLEATRNTNFPKNQCPSPCDYATNQQKKKSHNYAPFNSTSKLNRTLQKKKNNEYQRSKQNEEQLITVVDELNTQQQTKKKMSSIFKSGSQRIIHKCSDVPGPGSYELMKKCKKQKINKIEKNHYTVQEKNDRIITTLPSFTDVRGKKIIEQQKIQKKQSSILEKKRALTAQEVRLLKGPSWSSIRMIKIKQKEEQDLPGPGTYDIQHTQQGKGVTSCFHSPSLHFNAKKLRKLFCPGPGSYDINQKQPIRIFSQSHFNSKSSRFPKNKSISNVGPGSYMKDKKQQVTNVNKKKVTNVNKKKVDMPKEKIEERCKAIFNTHLNCNPGPGEYVDQQSMNYQLQKSLIKRHKISQFSCGCREIFNTKKQEKPGPGTYDLTGPGPKKRSKRNVGYKKVQVINMKAGQDSPSPCHYVLDIHTISNKIEKLSKKIIFAEKKAFNKGTLRFGYNVNQREIFNGYSNIINQYNRLKSEGHNECSNISFEGPKKVKKLIMTSVKVKVPFGSSVMKQKTEQITPIGPGTYNQNISWIKETHNIKGKQYSKY